jgi:L-cysteine S-thiosulfotransferase
MAREPWIEAKFVSEKIDDSPHLKWHVAARGIDGVDGEVCRLVVREDLAETAFLDLVSEMVRRDEADASQNSFTHRLSAVHVNTASNVDIDRAVTIIKRPPWSNCKARINDALVIDEVLRCFRRAARFEIRGRCQRQAARQANLAGDKTMLGVAARLPKIVSDGNAARVLTLEGAINRCRVTQQALPELAYESQALLSLTAYLAHQSRGVVRKLTDTDTPHRQRVMSAGRAFFETRQGQMNLACNQCHDDLSGRKLRGDTISQGQTHGWPAYRLEWQTLGSLRRRLRACSLGVKAEILPFGDPAYLALEYYLAWRGEGLPLESPGVRR